jgi:hypothetical protein
MTKISLKMQDSTIALCMAFLTILVTRFINYTDYLGYAKIGGFAFFISIIMASSSLVIMNSKKNALLMQKFLFTIQYVIACTIISSAYQLLLELDFSYARLLIVNTFALFSIASTISLGIYELLHWMFRKRKHE